MRVYNEEEEKIHLGGREGHRKRWKKNSCRVKRCRQVHMEVYFPSVYCINFHQQRKVNRIYLSDWTYNDCYLFQVNFIERCKGKVRWNKERKKINSARERKKKNVLVRYVSWNVRSSKFSFSLSLSFLFSFILSLFFFFLSRTNSLDLTRHLIIGFISLFSAVVCCDWWKSFKVTDCTDFQFLLCFISRVSYIERSRKSKRQLTLIMFLVLSLSLTLCGAFCAALHAAMATRQTHSSYRAKKKRKRGAHTHTTYIWVIFHERRTLGTFNWNQWNFLLCHGCCVCLCPFSSSHAFSLPVTRSSSSRRAFYSPPVVS